MSPGRRTRKLRVAPERSGLGSRAVLPPVLGRVRLPGAVFVSDRDNYRVQALGARGARSCGNPGADRSERFHLSISAGRVQRFRRDFAVRVRVRCDRACVVRVGGSVRIAGRRAALRLHRRTAAVPPYAPTRSVLVVPGERDTDRVVAALRPGRRVVASVTATGTDLRGRRLRRAARTRLR
jgi:hypothetical protein